MKRLVGRTGRGLQDSAIITKNLLLEKQNVDVDSDQTNSVRGQMAGFRECSNNPFR
jgi:hypothetical protein